jgi:hypothetical protein
VQSLAERDAEGEDDEYDESADAPAHEVFAAASSAALVPLDRSERAHGT